MTSKNQNKKGFAKMYSFRSMIMAVSVLLSACIPTPNMTIGKDGGAVIGATERDDTRKAPKLQGTSWDLVLLGSRTAVWPSRITFGKDDYEGRSACNGHGGTYKQDGPRLTFSRGMSTMAACEGTQEEQELFLALSETDRIGLDDKRLFLIDKKGLIIAAFRRSNR